MGNVSRSFYNDLRNARKGQSDVSKTIEAKAMVEQINRNGLVSKMAGSQKYFATLDAAIEYVDNMRRMNPTLNLNYRITEINR